jgi:hypothetical protein
VTEAKLVYEPVLTSDGDGNISYQAGAFPNEQEAQKVLDIWRAEGRTEEMAINIVHIYETAEEWLADQ